MADKAPSSTSTDTKAANPVPVAAELAPVTLGDPVWVQPSVGAYMLNEVGTAYPDKPSKVNATAYVLRCLKKGDLVQVAQP